MIALRPHQQRGVDGVYTAWNSGARRVCLTMPTGGGKTITAGAIVQACVARGQRALWVAHRIELVDQACATLQRLGVRAGAVCEAAQSAVDVDAPVQVATVQTLAARGM